MGTLCSLGFTGRAAPENKVPNNRRASQNRRKNPSDLAETDSCRLCPETPVADVLSQHTALATKVMSQDIPDSRTCKSRFGCCHLVGFWGW